MDWRIAIQLLDDPVDANLATRRYRMDSQCKGICLIINNMADSPNAPFVVKGMPTDTFEKLGFRIIYRENVSSVDIRKLMREMQNEDHTTYNCFVCCICSHGGELGVEGADGIQVDVDALRKYFYATECKSLAGKPKVFFVEACRGNERAGTVEVEDTEVKGDCTDGGSVTRRWELDEDHFFMSYATTPHHVALYTGRGGHFFRCLTTNLLVHAARLPVDDILMLVGDRLGELGLKQTPICESTLRKKLYFKNDQPETRTRVDAPRRPAHPMGAYQDVYGRLVYPAPYPGEQVMSGATYPQDGYGHYVYPAPYLEEHVMSGATYLQDMRGHYVYPAYYPGQQVMSGATYPQMTAEREEERPREGGDAVRTRRDKKHCVIS
ncbi:caspase-7-like isoform X2 [Littorina saxatilis]|uniref:caspase-7-like isoform X1 n=1 Tax=Littorina saxatilis TaxID=31220 RepID=UPI0038B43117